MARLIRAAGGVVVRNGADGPAEVVLVHRPRYDDWSLPKGKVDPGETESACALREVAEETNLSCRLGPELGSTEYIDSRGRPKSVRYWVMEVYDGEIGTPFPEEVDEARWFTAAAARSALSYDRDREMVDRALRATSKPCARPPADRESGS